MAKNGSEPRRALVTGGASGLGHAVAEALLAKGAAVAIGDVDETALAAAAKTLNSQQLLALKLDVTSRDSVRNVVSRCVEEFGGLDTLVNSAGVIDFTPLEEISEDQWDRVVDVNLKGVFFCCQAAAPYLRASGRGRIVTISSDAGKKGVALISSYCASKFGIIGFSRAIAGELAPSGVTVNCVCPIGVASTRMGQAVLEWLAGQTGDSKRNILAAREQGTLLGRMPTAADVVNAIMFFIADESAYLTGEALDVDGGTLNSSLIPGIMRK